MISSLYISFPSHSWVLILLIIAAVIFVYWTYRRTVPEISPILRLNFIVLRSLTLIFLLILIFNPEFILKKDSLKKPSVAVLIDGSASINYKDRMGIRSDVVKELLSDKNQVRLEEQFEVDFYSFSDSVYSLEDLNNLSFNGTSSDIANALKSVSNGEGNYTSILVISDGAYNVGADPVRSAESSHTPVFTVGIGDSVASQDFSLVDIRNSPIIYSGDSLQIKAVVTGFRNTGTTIRLKDENDKTLAVKKVFFDETGGEEKVELDILPGEPGSKMYTLSVDSINGEQNLDNNERHFSVKVLPRKIEVLLMLGAPSPDFAFMKRILNRNPDIKLTSLVERDKTGFYQGKTYESRKDRDVIIFLNYPTALSNKRILSEILGEISSGISVLIIPGTNFNGELLNEIDDYLPVIFKTRKEEPSEKRVYPNENISPLTQFFSEEYLTSDLPPLTGVGDNIEFKDFAKIAARFENGVPAMGFSVQNEVKAAGFAVYDFWKYSLQDQSHAISYSLITHFWYNLIRWLSTKGEEDLFRLSTGKDVFSSGEKIPLSATVYDKSFLPVGDADVRVRIKGADGEYEIKLEGTGDGQFYNYTRIITEGEYQIEAKAIAGRDTLEYSGGFIVERFNPESLNPAMRADVLRGIAGKSGGRFYAPDEFDKFFEDFNPEPEHYVIKSEFRFFPRWASAAAIAFLLAIEWIIRKRKGML